MKKNNSPKSFHTEILLEEHLFYQCGYPVNGRKYLINWTPFIITVRLSNI